MEAIQKAVQWMVQHGATDGEVDSVLSAAGLGKKQPPEYGKAMRGKGGRPEPYPAPSAGGGLDSRLGGLLSRGANPSTASAASRRVYVGNLPYSTRPWELKEHMQSAGKVVACDIMQAPGTACGSKGCAIVEYASAREAQAAIRFLTNTLVADRPIFVREDREGGMDVGFKGKGAGFGLQALHGKGDGGSRLTSEVGNSLYIGNLSYAVTEEELLAVMQQAGDVIQCDILKDPAGNSKGCAIVKYADSEDAKRALDGLRETLVHDRPIWIREDREDPFTPGGGGGGGLKGKCKGGSKGGSAFANNSTGRKDCRVYVGNLPFSTSWQDLKDHMRQAGNVTHCDIIAAPGTAMGSKGCGIVVYETPEEAQLAISTMSNTLIQGRPIYVREDREGQ